MLFHRNITCQQSTKEKCGRINGTPPKFLNIFSQQKIKRAHLNTLRAGDNGVGALRHLGTKKLDVRSLRAAIVPECETQRGPPFACERGYSLLRESQLKGREHKGVVGNKGAGGSSAEQQHISRAPSVAANPHTR
jgi:hypothetical protein